MATISWQLECRNFVTAKASLKEVRTVWVATHIRLEKGRIARLRPVECSTEVPRMREAGAGTAQRIAFELDGICYCALAQPALTDARVSSVLFRAPEEVKVTNWSLEDMAYFLQVCEYCHRLKCSPIQALEDPDALYSSFAEIVNCVMSRNFVLCEFASLHNLFLT